MLPEFRTKDDIYDELIKSNSKMSNHELSQRFINISLKSSLDKCSQNTSNKLSSP